MPSLHDLAIAQRIQSEITALGLSRKQEQKARAPAPQDYVGFYDGLISSEPLRSATKKLYVDGHYARAVEEAYKCLNNTVQVKAGLSLDGADLMQQVFSEKNPVLKFNDLRTESQRNEQVGYMMILAGCMRGIRNPRAHDYKLWDSPDVALELLVLGNQLMRMVAKSKRSRQRKR